MIHYEGEGHKEYMFTVYLKGIDIAFITMYYEKLFTKINFSQESDYNASVFSVVRSQS